MNLKSKPHDEHHKQIAQQKLDARLAMLQSLGTSPKTIERDAMIRKLKAQIKKANQHLKQVAKQMNLTDQNKKHKEEKAVAEKLARESGQGHKKHSRGPIKDKKIRERRPESDEQD